MNIIADLHSHSDLSHHAFSSLDEMMAAAAEIGLHALALTNHTSALEDGAQAFHFASLWRLPREIRGVRFLGGAELNVMDDKGTVDLDEGILKSLDFVVASLHSVVCAPRDFDYHTASWLAIAQNPLIDCIGHSGQECFSYDIDRVVRACADTGTVMEINSASPHIRPDSRGNCCRIAKACMKYGVQVAVNSDAHSRWEVGQFEEGLKLLDEVGFPEELVINSSRERLAAYFEKRKGLVL